MQNASRFISKANFSKNKKACFRDPCLDFRDQIFVCPDFRDPCPYFRDQILVCPDFRGPPRDSCPDFPDSNIRRDYAIWV